MGAWIEIRMKESSSSISLSLLSWERGLKFVWCICHYMILVVVAPLVGAWIEILIISPSSTDFLSLLSWERGLKSDAPIDVCCSVVVAPLVGAWIEIST